MFRKVNMKQIIFFISLSLIFLLNACAPLQISFAEPTPTVQPSPTPTLQVVTQVVLVTQVIVPTVPIITPTVEVPVAPTFDPYSVPIWYPLKDCPASRLHIGEKAMVAYGGTPNAIRYGSDLHVDDNIIAYAMQGEILDIQDGPFCSYGWIVWQVRTADGTIGFTPEGDGEEYWLLPVP